MIKLICIGKIKENYLKDLITDYKQRLNKYHKFEIIELNDSEIKKEAELIIKNLNQKDFIVTLEIEGKELSSVELAHNIDKWLMNYSHITFIIGGSNGLDESVKKLANYKLSFSHLTFPHGLFRGIFLEQIYRSFKINNNETYHK